MRDAVGFGLNARAREGVAVREDCLQAERVAIGELRVRGRCGDRGWGRCSGVEAEGDFVVGGYSGVE